LPDLKPPKTGTARFSAPIVAGRSKTGGIVVRVRIVVPGRLMGKGSLSFGCLSSYFLDTFVRAPV